jgi:hypothetical protein
VHRFQGVSRGKRAEIITKQSSGRGQFAREVQNQIPVFKLSSRECSLWTWGGVGGVEGGLLKPPIRPQLGVSVLRSPGPGLSSVCVAGTLPATFLLFGPHFPPKRTFWKGLPGTQASALGGQGVQRASCWAFVCAPPWPAPDWPACIPVLIYGGLGGPFPLELPEGCGACR